MTANKIFLLLLFVASLALTPLLAEEDHPHDHDEEVPSKVPHDDGEHKGERKEGKRHDQEEHEEENNAVGPEKGILEFHPEKGFRLSPEATKNFGIAVKSIVLSKAGFEIPLSALLEAQDGKYIYLEKSGVLKRVPIKVLKKTANTMFIKSEALSPEDKVVTSGVPFLRGAELDVTTGGGSHGH